MDMFDLINKQLEIIGKKLSGELYPEYIKIVCSAISNILEKEKKKIISEYQIIKDNTKGN